MYQLITNEFGDRFESESGEEYTVNTSTLTRKSFLPFVKNCESNEVASGTSLHYQIQSTKANIYYAFSEDTNPFLRERKTCGCPQFPEETAQRKPEEESDCDHDYLIKDCYCEDVARHRYLSAKPTCYVIFGKPGLETHELARHLSQTLKCVLISPESVIRDEIRRKTRKGNYVLKLLETGESVNLKIILNLMENRVKEQDVLHRGYVLQGLPLTESVVLSDLSFLEDVDSDDDSYMEHYLAQQSKINLFFDYSVETIFSSNEDLLFKDIDFGFVEGETGRNVKLQMDRVFGAWPMGPSVIVYAVCPDEDLIKMKIYEEIASDVEYVLGNLKENVSANFQTVTPSLDSQSYESYGEYDITAKSYQDFYDERSSEMRKTINDIKKRVYQSCKIYKKCVLPSIESKLLSHNPQNVIRVDGRGGATTMYQVASTKLTLLPLTRVFVPEKMLKNQPEAFEGNFDRGKTNLQHLISADRGSAFEQLSLKDAATPVFPWRISNWGFYCPVELYQGRLVEGSPEFSLRFMDKMYFLSSEENARYFVENPRTFLLPPNPVPAIRIAIFGPKYSGKSALSCFLSETFGGKVIDVEDLEHKLINEFREGKIEEAKKKLLPIVIAELTRKLQEERRERESERLLSLECWCNGALKALNVIDDSYGTECESEEYEASFDLESLEMAIDLEEIRENHDLMKQHAPDYLQTEELPVREIASDDPELLAALDERTLYLYNERIELTEEFEEYRFCSLGTIINSVSQYPAERGFFRQEGFILDGMYTDPEIWTKINQHTKIHDVIHLTEKEPYENLVKNWKSYKYLSEEITAEEENVNIFQECEGDCRDYVNQVIAYEEKWKLLQGKIQQNDDCVITECDLLSVENINDHVRREIIYRYEYKPQVKIEEEEILIKIIKNATPTTSETEEESDESSGEDESTSSTSKQKEEEEQRAVKNEYEFFGDSNEYCPVALVKYNVLRKGKSQFATLYRDKIYKLCCEEALDEFLVNTKNYVPFSSPIEKFPPLRICIVGPQGSGKSTVAEVVSNVYGFVHVDYWGQVDNHLRENGSSSIVNHIKYPISLEMHEYLERILPDENTADEIYDSNDKLIKRYFEKGGSIPRSMLKDSALDFFDKPYLSSEIVFDAFPSCLSDVKTCWQSYAVPEIIVELECTREQSVDRIVPRMFEEWSLEQRRLKQLEEEKRLREMAKLRRDWQEAYGECSSRSGEFQDYEDDYESMPQNYYGGEMGSDEDEEEEQFWEEPKDALNRMRKKIEENYDCSMNLLVAMRSYVQEDGSVPWVSINSEDDKAKVIFKVLKTLEPFLFRNKSMLERTYNVDLKTAESLLESGYFLLSSFGRYCPVQLFDDKNPFNMFLPLEAQREIYPVIHRHYIYFIGGKNNSLAFAQDPLKYVAQRSTLPIIPACISIIGPPKSGKTTLAERFARSYQLQIVTRQESLDYVSKNFPWASLESLVHKSLSDSQLLAKAVELFALNSPLAASQGFILDGFPANKSEAKQLVLLSVQPTIVIDLNVNFWRCYRYFNSSDEGPVDVSLYEDLHKKWQLDQQKYRKWLKGFAQNVVQVDGSKCKWSVWLESNKYVCEWLRGVKDYFKNVNCDVAHALKYLSVSPYEFRQKQSVYESFCLACLKYEDKFVSNSPIDRQGAFQFRQHFYWLCEKHSSSFVKDPLSHLTLPERQVELPKERPIILKHEIDVNHACVHSRLMFDGLCVVTYVDNLPKRKLTMGKSNLAVLYADKIYLFCSVECREKFATSFLSYAEVTINFKESVPEISIRALPNLGFLEQVIADTIIQVVHQVAMTKLKVPGLSGSTSAAICLAVGLKAHASRCKQTEKSIHRETISRIKTYSQIVEWGMQKMKKQLCPFA